MIWRSIPAYAKYRLVSWSDDKELSSGANDISWNSLKKKTKLKSDNTLQMTKNNKFFIVFIILPNELHPSQRYHHVHHFANLSRHWNFLHHHQPILYLLVLFILIIKKKFLLGILVFYTHENNDKNKKIIILLVNTLFVVYKITLQIWKWSVSV